ncbi:hypothetical protein KSD_12740 [Ktedonobacter sp. SOSP1-85]|uniref:Uncharacterized protein n=1 Tax=Ktedonobacter robiniae TaxID=2778365 RepID=A0ABQ3UQ94_9CHLR|nr:hypothetical protein KSB_33310 [Ktedonobacter robiniae]GHO73503.1 hypothetical protein KSD_12740 [Ktedonobacter sp. SOSP1-85]
MAKIVLRNEVTIPCELLEVAAQRLKGGIAELPLLIKSVEVFVKSFKLLTLGKHFCKTYM